MQHSFSTFQIYSTSQHGLATFQVLSVHRWLVATLLGSPALDPSYQIQLSEL